MDAPAKEQVDLFSGRTVVVAVVLLAVMGMVGAFVLTLKAMNATTPEQAVALMGVAAAFFSPTMLLIGGLVNAMTLRFGSNPQELKEVTGLAYVPGSQEGMSAGAWAVTNVPHDPATEADIPTAPAPTAPPGVS